MKMFSKETASSEERVCNSCVEVGQSWTFSSRGLNSLTGLLFEVGSTLCSLKECDPSAVSGRTRLLCPALSNLQ
jgi:hypothetical protein